MNFDFSYTSSAVMLKVHGQKQGFLDRFFYKKSPNSINDVLKDHQALAFAIADLRALADEKKETIKVQEESLEFSHRLAGELDVNVATILGLPPLVDLSLRTDAEGTLGSSSFRLRYEWRKGGVKQQPVRVGCVLETADGTRRIPFWMLEALQVADELTANPTGTDTLEVNHWEALARFRKALDPIESEQTDVSASMTSFLSNLNVSLVDKFSISPNTDGTDFEIVPFSGRAIENAGLNTEDGSLSERSSELQDGSLNVFQETVRRRGAMTAYRIGKGNYVVVDRSAAPALEVMTKFQRANEAERVSFIKNPRDAISEAYSHRLRELGEMDGLGAEGEEELVEQASGPVFIETREFSERVTGVRVFQPESTNLYAGDATTWLPEQFVDQLSLVLSSLGQRGLISLQESIRVAIDEGRDSVEFDGFQIPARSEVLALTQEHIDRLGPSVEDKTVQPEAVELEGPIVLGTKVNFQSVLWSEKIKERKTRIDSVLPAIVRTKLKEHQHECFQWQIKAWKKGLPGVLNADEQGLGKTLETIAFLAWLQQHTATKEAMNRGPILVVAPTSLLENWEKEVSKHLDGAGLGEVIRLYGSGISQQRLASTSGKDTDDGVVKLDFSALREACLNGEAHKIWVLTTYTTLTNYHHSLARIPFSAIVFDEIQAIKNPISLRAAAARSLNANFRIGLTGTPIENSSLDLWAIMDVLASGALGSMDEYRANYEKPNAENMQELYERVFTPQDGLPPISLRRVKEVVAADLPTKTRRLHPRLMPAGQSSVYSDARLTLASKRPGAALKALHHIRSVSVHPTLSDPLPDEIYIQASARLNAVMSILSKIAKKGERALVFIEHRQMQYRFIELVRRAFDLKNVDLINGDTPIKQRQQIVDRFQLHQPNDGVFDLLVLGPKAAGTGLTLTAATHVIHLSRWWNPAVEEQCNDRVHRLGQSQPVQIHIPMAIHPDYREKSFDCLLHSLMQRKRRLAKSALWPMGDTESDSTGLQEQVGSASAYDRGNEDQTDVVGNSIRAMFLRDGEPQIVVEQDGSILVQ